MGDPSNLVTVPNAAQMVQQRLREHIRKRHDWLRFWSRGEHDADHRERPERQDHTHVE